MAEPYIGEIRLFAFPRVPNGWVACDGHLLSISAFSALFAVIGTIYGGDGVTTFATPDLRGRVGIGQGQGPGLPSYQLGEVSGEENHTLISNEMPSHSHALTSSTAVGATALPGPTVHLATASSGYLYAPPANIPSYDVMASCIVSNGNGLPHDNMMPTIVANYCMAYNGVFPSPT